MLAGPPSDTTQFLETGYPTRNVQDFFTGVSQKTEENDTFTIFYRLSGGIYTSFPPLVTSGDQEADNVLFTDAFLAVPDADSGGTPSTYNLGWGAYNRYFIVGGTEPLNDFSVTRSGRVEVRAILTRGDWTAAGNHLAQIDFDNSTLLQAFAFDEGADRYVAWGQPSTYVDSGNLNSPTTLTGAVSTDASWQGVPVDSPRDGNPADFNLPAAESSKLGKQNLARLPNRWNFDNALPDGVTIFGVNPNYQIPHNISVPQGRSDTHSRIYLFFPWEDVSRISSISMGAPGLPAVDLWRADGSLPEPFFKVYQEPPRLNNRWVRSAVFESVLGQTTAMQGQTLHINLR